MFDAMFNSTLATEEDEITIPDVEPAAFLSLLKFLYSDEVQIGPETVMTTLYTAKKYAVPACECNLLQLKYFNYFQSVGRKYQTGRSAFISSAIHSFVKFSVLLIFESKSVYDMIFYE